MCVCVGGCVCVCVCLCAVPLHVCECVCFCLKLRVLFVEWSSGAHSDRWCKLLIAVFPVAECGGPCPPSLSSFSFPCSFSLSLSLPFLSFFLSFFCGSGLPLKHPPHFSVQTALRYSQLYLLFPLSTYRHLFPSTWAQTGIVQENKMCLFHPGRADSKDQSWKNFLYPQNPFNTSSEVKAESKSVFTQQWYSWLCKRQALALLLWDRSTTNALTRTYDLICAFILHLFLFMCCLLCVSEMTVWPSRTRYSSFLCCDTATVQALQHSV